MGRHDEAVRLQFATRRAWRTWLMKNHDSSTGLFVIYVKKSATRPGPTYDDLIEEALCFGWVDGTLRTVDDERTSLWFCPRRSGSGWAATNEARVEQLRSAQLMRPVGEEAITRAKADGSWRLLDRAESMRLPPELERALADLPGARAAFDAVSPRMRKQFIYQVDSAKRAETRAGRAQQIARSVIAG